MYEPNKSLGQNFLTDSYIAQDMVELLKISSEYDVVEIGSGLGALTEILGNVVRETHSRLYAVEVDARFTPKLKTEFSLNPQVEVIIEDALKFLPNFASDKALLVIGSLPFYSTSQLICTIIKMATQPTRITLLVQKEVAEKLTAGTPDASFLSSFSQAFYNTNYVQTVPSAKFTPQPNVDGAVLFLEKNETILDRTQVQKFEGFLHRGFKNPRKMTNKTFSKVELEAAKIDPALRPEAISVEHWLKLFTNSYE